jgi:hypothetical protein
VGVRVIAHLPGNFTEFSAQRAGELQNGEHQMMISRIAYLLPLLSILKFGCR